MDSLEKIGIEIRKIEERKTDTWIDISLEELRKGVVRFYRVNDPLTGQWLFKICRDVEMQRTTVKAIKCPSGIGFSQLEGRTMLFQKSLTEGYCYDVVSLSYLDDKQRLRRNVVVNIDEVPEILKNHFKIVDYQEATGKQAVGKSLVTLCEENDEKKMLFLFLIERAWPLSTVPPEVSTKMIDLYKMIKSLEKAALEEIYTKAQEQHQLAREETDRLLNILETEGKIQKTDQYIKTRNK
ncbi:hypothetical protein KEJ18_02415 [Candidatus Bathyarchaeota archaeon]|nr:hypothetical protein [Candidatus Bathyarchaeota archaeon]